MRMRGLIAQVRKEYDTAEQLYQNALAIFRDLKNDIEAANILCILGELERIRERYNAAEQYYRDALLSGKQNIEIQINAEINLGLLALDREIWTEARARFNEALTLARELGRQSAVSLILYGLARAYEGEVQYNIALQLAKEALAIQERLQYVDLAETRELVERLTKKENSEE